jgi:uncharacterized protein YndB with AHSA1/START domain
MPKQKDLKRLVRARMQKTGEAYTTARQQLLKKVEPEPNYAELAGMSDEAISKNTGRTWKEWVRVLDAVQAAEKPHGEIARYVHSLGTPDWWTQGVTVGYERIRGLRDKGQRRGGGYEASKSRTFAVPVSKLYKAFANARTRQKWLPVKVAIRTAIADKSIRLTWDDGSIIVIGFLPKGTAKSAVAVVHSKLPDRAAIAKVKELWSGYFDRLDEVLTPR